MASSDVGGGTCLMRCSAPVGRSFRLADGGFGFGELVYLEYDSESYSEL